MGFYGYLVTVVMTAVIATLVAALLIRQVVLLLMRQVKLYHSIKLVELKTSKLAYWVFAALIGVFIFFTVTAMSDPESVVTEAIKGTFDVTRAHVNIALMFALLAMVSAEAFVIVLAISKTAVVDKGVYTNFGMLDWHQVRDYIIDETRCVLVLSSDKNTFYTLDNLTTPFKVKREDIEKLKFILNKNKNKFSGFDGGED
ncbi:MAG: hypothetical protein J1G04_04080 [Clostridiales bacterium]|nr:hypothetical protein [Clostridiales bacterium]